jgi:DeoR family transcriptional regulator, fructose operon transcriptional repressor
MLTEKRRNIVADYIKNNEYARIEELSKKLNVSGSTVRRDLEMLEKSGLLERVHGGARKPAGMEKAMSFTFFNEQMNLEKEEKKRIAGCAADMVKEGEIVIIDAGSTGYYIAEQLKNKDIHVITNSLPAINVLVDSKVDLVAIGGSLYSNAGVFLGALAEDMLKGVNADKLFMGVGGIYQNQITNRNMLLVGVQRIMIDISKEIIVVADHTKFDKKALCQVSDISCVDRIITGEGVPDEYKAICRKNKVVLDIC